MKHFPRFAALSSVLLLFPLHTIADCGSDCQSDYNICMSGGDARGCSVELSTCTQKCVLHSKRYGAIAYSESKEVFGYTYDYDADADANRAAVGYCRKQGAGDCKVLITFYNACGALALGDKGAYGADWGENHRMLRRRALNTQKI